MTAPPVRAARADLLPKIGFATACLFFAFLYGFAAAQYQWFPHAFLSKAFAQGEQAAVAPLGFGLHHVHKARHDLQGVLAYTADGTVVPAAVGASGSTLLTSYWEDHGGLPGLRLIDAAGKTLHHWDANPARIWPESPHKDMLRGLFNVSSNYVHGSHLFANGDVLFNIEYMGLVRMDATGKVLWRLDRRTHHSVTPDDQGNFWVCAADWIETEAQRRGRFPGLSLPIAEDRALRVSPAGEVLEELSILEVVFASGLKELIWRVGPNRTIDILHSNDVEPLSAAMAGAYPMFAAGDLVISLCHLDVVMVVDPKTSKLKWYADSPFLEQHDPDFIGDGWISIFDNHGDGTDDGRHLGGSRLWAIRPHTGERRQLYPVPDAHGRERPFFTKHGGKAQLLDNGHWVLTEAQTGRVFEIDAHGRTVWEWGQQRRADGVTISEVLEGRRYPFTEEVTSRWPRRR